MTLPADGGSTPSTTGSAWWVIAYTNEATAPTYDYFYGTQAAAKAKAATAVEVTTQPAISGPFATEAQAKAAVASGSAKTPAVTVNPLTANGVSITNPLDYLEDVGDFFHRLTEAATWERVGEVAVGVLLLYIGVKALTQNTAVGTASKKTSSAATTAAKVIGAIPK
jgi:hypothetical protein